MSPLGGFLVVVAYAVHGTIEVVWNGVDWVLTKAEERLVDWVTRRRS